VVRLSDGSALHYDRLLIATGASPVAPFPYDEHVRIHVLRTHDDAVALRAELRRAKRAVVIGAGLIGCEVASSARHLGIETDIVDITLGPFQRVLGEAFARRIEEIQIEAGVATHYGRGVAHVRRASGEHPLEVELSTGEILAADVVVAGTGVRPATAWLEGSGIDAGQGIVCDPRLRTSVPNVFGAGDVVSWPGGPSGQLIRLEHWTNAAQQGVAAAISMASEDPNGDNWLHGTPNFTTTIHSHRLTVLGHTHGGDVDDPAIQVAAGPNGKGLIALYGNAQKLVGVATIDQPRAAVRLAGLFGEEGSWSASLESLAQASVKN
jgi:NADPH-dependent 2,4-dienoyl-CoA reductase/sulfur reductase-like enzyme